jgi:hypothetical protein
MSVLRSLQLFLLEYSKNSPGSNSNGTTPRWMIVPALIDACSHREALQRVRTGLKASYPMPEECIKR